MPNFFKKILAHKIILILVLLAAATSGYFGFKQLKGNKETKTGYVTSEAKNGSITVSVSGTGQVSVLNQVDLKPETSGKIVYIGVKNGQEVEAGELIAQIDASDAVQDVRDAKDSLETAELTLEKLLEPTDELTITKAKNSLEQAKESKTDAEDNLVESYEDGYNDVTDAFLDIPGLMAGLDDVIYGSDFGSTQWNIDYYETLTKQYIDAGKIYQVDQYVDKVIDSYNQAREHYEENLEDYQDTGRYSSEEVIEKLISQTYETSKDISESIKNMKNLIDFYEDTLTQKDISLPSTVRTHQSNLESYTGTINGHISSLSSSKSNISNTKSDIIDTERNIQEKTGDLAELLEDPDPLEIRSQKLTIQQKKNALADAQQKLADYYIRAPFDGIIAEVDAQLGESASSGTAIATIITSQKIAEITLNEIDAATVKVGQKVILEFDAVEDLSITGEVAEIDTLGTVSSGVVSYGVKITFDVQDERVKSGMSLSANIIIESKQNILTVPIGAVKTMDDTSYVEILVDGQAQRTTVVTGTSNDTTMEITEGLAEGDQVITQTTGGGTASTNSSKSNNDTMRGMMQLNGGGGGPPQ